MSDTQTSSHGYDADAKAKARTDAPVTIGEQTFHLRRRTWPVALEIRKVARQQERTLAKIKRHARELDRLNDPEVTKRADGETVEAFEVRIDARTQQIEDALETLHVELDHLAYLYVATGLHPDGESADETADVDFLKAHLAAEEVGELVGRIAGAEEDPTPAPTTEATPATT